jgi:hypothetical protein
LPGPEPPWVLELLPDHETPSGPLAQVSVTITRFTDADGEMIFIHADPIDGRP